MLKFKKRTAMKTRMKLSSVVSIKPFILLPLITLVLIALSSCGKNKLPEGIETPAAPLKVDGAYQNVDIKPQFPGGDTALLNYIAVSVKYPEESKLKGIQGQVIAKFMVTDDGSVSSVSILKSADPLLDAETVRVVSSLPRFTPGKLKGVNVPVWFMLPVNFKLQ
jgi:TonB family protein